MMLTKSQFSLRSILLFTLYLFPISNSPKQHLSLHVTMTKKKKKKSPEITASKFLGSGREREYTRAFSSAIKCGYFEGRYTFTCRIQIQVRVSDAILISRPNCHQVHLGGHVKPIDRQNKLGMFHSSVLAFVSTAYRDGV